MYLTQPSQLGKRRSVAAGTAVSWSNCQEPLMDKIPISARLLAANQREMKKMSSMTKEEL